MFEAVEKGESQGVQLIVLLTRILVVCGGGEGGVAGSRQLLLQVRVLWVCQE
jgi:hypothetical protein